MSRVISCDFYLEVAKGHVPGHSIVNKFGQNNNLNSSTYENVNDMGGVYSYPASALITKIDSSSGSDTGDAEVQGLSADGTLTVQTATLTGTTPVTLATPLWRVFRVKNVGSSDWVGTVQCINDADSATYAQVAIGNNQTLMSQYTIPLGVTGYLLHEAASISDNNRSVSAAGRIEARPFGGVFQLKSTFGISDANSRDIMYPLPVRYQAKTDIHTLAKGDANGVVVNSTYAILLVED